MCAANIFLSYLLFLAWLFKLFISCFTLYLPFQSILVVMLYTVFVSVTAGRLMMWLESLYFFVYSSIQAIKLLKEN